MAETHQEVVKVWIAPGCIVCDACEAECPDVFDVQEETCVIRPEAQSADFTKPLTPSIIDAAEGCPVDVIKFETIEVEGPEPWAGQEEAAAASAPAGGGGGHAPAKKAGPAIPDGPPDPKWAKLLSSSATSGSRSSGGAYARVSQAAKAPVEAVASATPRNAPPDAQVATMIASGLSRPRMGLKERIRAKAQAMSGAAQMTRRQFNYAMMAGWALLAFCAATFGAALQSFLVPKVTKEPPSSFRAGTLSDYAEPGVYEQYKGSQGVWLVYLPEGQLVAVSTICTHLGCIPNWLPGESKFKCPCHGSGFYMNGVNFEGPAPRPLERFKISLDGATVVVDKSFIYRAELNQWGLDGAYVNV